MRLYSLLMIALLSACTPEVQPFNAAMQKEALLKDEVFHATDEAQLPYRAWEVGKKPKAVIVALHGMNDYSRAFEGSGAYFKEHGIALYAYDQRGFGRSPNVGIWPGEENMVGDLRQYIEVLKKCYPKAPIFILGESMGGAVAITALSDPTFPKVNGVILSAPAVWGAETMNPIYRSTLWMAAHTLPFRQVTGSDLKIIASNNYPMLRALSYDPLIIKSTRVDAVYGMVHLMDSAYDKIPEVRTPVMMLYGGMDQVIPPHAIKNALSRFSIPVEYVYYPDGYHMLLRDLQGERVMADILSWMKNPRKPLPSGYGIVREPGSAPVLQQVVKN